MPSKYARANLLSLDDFTQLNEKFIKARRDYESLLEASMSHPQQSYGARPPYGAYNAPPPPSAAYAGYPPTSPPPQQQDPSRFNYPPAAASQPPPSQYPPAGTNPAFFMVPPGQQRPTQQQTPKPEPPSADPYAPSQPGRVPPSAGAGGRPQSFAPQELATGHYDSPVDQRHSFAMPPSAPPPSGNEYQGQGQIGYAPPPPQGAGGAPPGMYEGQQQQQQQQQGYGYAAPPPQQPNHAPPVVPGGSSPPPPQAGQAYLAYRPGGQGQVGTGGGGDEGFYR